MNDPSPFPTWIAKFIRRLLGLQPGRWEITLSVFGDGRRDWTVKELGKIEEA